MKKWSYDGPDDGVLVVKLTSWKHFHDFVQGSPIGNTPYVFRGQMDAEWPLLPTLARLVGRASVRNSPSLREEHLQRFYRSTMGRRGALSLSKPNRPSRQNLWWALGQHYGLATPLLDWTYSPFVAAFFAFSSDVPLDGDQVAYRVVWALDRARVELRSDAIRRKYKIDCPESKVRPPIIEFIDPDMDSNARLISQRGLFSRSPIGIQAPNDIAKWVPKYFANKSEPVLVKIQIPNHAPTRDDFLRDLNRMNINPLTLFPDLEGSSMYANLALEIDGYDVT